MVVFAANQWRREKKMVPGTMWEVLTRQCYLLACISNVNTVVRLWVGIGPLGWRFFESAVFASEVFALHFVCMRVVFAAPFVTVLHQAASSTMASSRAAPFPRCQFHGDVLHSDIWHLRCPPLGSFPMRGALHYAGNHNGKRLDI